MLVSEALSALLSGILHLASPRHLSGSRLLRSALLCLLWSCLWREGWSCCCCVFRVLPTVAPGQRSPLSPCLSRTLNSPGVQALLMCPSGLSKPTGAGSLHFISDSSSPGRNEVGPRG